MSLLNAIAGARSAIIAGAVCLAVGAGGGFAGCWWLRDQMAAGSALKQTKAVVAQTARAEAITQKAGEKTEAAKAEIRWRTRTLVERIPIYVREDAQHPAQFVPIGFVRLHDAAAGGTALPDAAGIADDAASAVTLATVAGTVIDNYGSCNATREQLIGLQGWVRAQQAAWDRR